MRAPTDAWRAGHRELTARVRALPALLEDGLARPAPPTRLDPARLRRVVVTGVGSSAAHARFLATLLADHLGLRTRVLPLSAFTAGPPADAADDGLIVCSQGLSPNARLALGRPDAWARVILLTAARPPESRLDDARDARPRGARAAAPGVEPLADPARVRSRAAALTALEAAGVEVRPFPAGENEDGTLVRVIGPMAGYLAALRLIDVLAAHAGRPPLLDAPARAGLRRALADAPVRLAAAVPAPIPTATTLAFVTTGGYGELVENLRAKVIEGMLRPPPAIWDLLELPHGPFQQLYDADATLLALTRADAPGESGLLERLAAMLVPARHRLLRLAAVLSGPLAVLEHEALMNELMLRDIEARRIDQREWRGRGKDAPLYDVGTEVLTGGGSPAARDRPAGEVTAAAVGARIRATCGAPPPLLECLTWPELERAVAAGRRTAILPLGATEQHGPHLPFATDTWVAEALAARVCAALEDAIQLPALALGCSTEHRAFPGTLDLAPATLEAVVGDVLRALAAHGFARALVFSAHGGNTAPLAAALGRLRAAAAPMTLIAFTDLAAVTATLHRIAGEHGVPPGVAGHHAGEVETSMLLALRPDAVRRAALAAGVTTLPADSQTLFYPSLRAHAPTGTVGDPRAADPARGAAYLDAWATLLVAAVRGAKNAP